MYIIDHFKHQVHRDVVVDPRSHGWALNLYLNGERYPQKVCDYFQSEFAPSPELAEQLVLHKKDETKHERLFAKGIRMIGQEVVELPIDDVFNEIVRSFTPGTFHIVESDSPDLQRKKLANFLAHAHFLERRIASSLCYHRDACEAMQRDSVANLVAAVLSDEERHVRYTRDSVFDLLTRQEAEATLEIHRRAEARANRKFSLMQLKGFLNRSSDTVPAGRRILYKICALIMEGAERYA